MLTSSPKLPSPSCRPPQLELVELHARAVADRIGCRQCRCLPRRVEQGEERHALEPFEEMGVDFTIDAGCAELVADRRPQLDQTSLGRFQPGDDSERTVLPRSRDSAMRPNTQVPESSSGTAPDVL